MPTVLHQMLALKGQRDSQMTQAIDAAFATACNASAMSGLSSSYEPFDVHDREIPQNLNQNDSRVAERVSDVINRMIAEVAPAVDINLTIGQANCAATAVVMLNGQPLFKDKEGKGIALPVTSLLELEKLMKIMVERAAKLVQLDDKHQWALDANDGLYKTAPTTRPHLRKVPQAFTRFAGDEHHPPQVDRADRDDPVGTITRTFSSGALPPAVHRALMAHLRDVHDAVASARMEANTSPVTQQKLGEILLREAFSPILGPKTAKA